MKILDISLLNTCNYTCSYCKLGKYHRMGVLNNTGSYDINGPIIDYFPLLSYIHNNFDSTWIVQITGGEPTIAPGFDMLVNSISTDYKVVVNTNGSRLQILKDRIKRDVTWRVSYHPTQLSFDAFKDNLKDIDNVFINYVLHPIRIRNGMCIEDINNIKTLNIPYEVSGFEGEYNGKYYRFFDKEYWDHISEPITRDNIEIIVIKPNGKVYPCHGVLKDEEPIGDIYKGALDMNNRCIKSCHAPTGVSLCPIHIPLARMKQHGL